MDCFEVTIIGGGIVGLATGLELLERNPGLRVAVLEKENVWAAHQTGRNSGVIHSGIYYKPGSMKARLAREGSRSMVEFCRQHNLPFEICGKVIVATREAQLPFLENLYRRGLQNGLDVVRLSSDEVRTIEPNVQCLAGIRVPTTGIVSYRGVCEKLSQLITERGGALFLGRKVGNIRDQGNGKIIETSQGAFQSALVVNCAGLHSDRVARAAGIDPKARIVPFRGEYYELRPERRHLVKGLIYPVPNPAFPFLGVHFTRMIDGSVHAGPNAVLSFKREGYHKSDFNIRDFCEVMAFPGFWKLARRHFREGMNEIIRSLSKAKFVQSLQELIPSIQSDDLIPADAGVRAQALLDDGSLVDDFLIIEAPHAVHVCNAPSPAATASLEIAKAIISRLPVDSHRVTAGVARVN